MRLTIPLGKVRAAEMLPVFQEMSNALVEAMVRQVEREGKKVSCRLGCTACCHQLIPLSEVEALHLAEYVRSQPDERRAELEGRFAETLRQMEEAGILQPLREPETRGDRTLREIGLTYLAHRIRCPFLEDGACSIHADRPLGCREYLVTSPNENCWEPSPETVEMVPMPARMSGALISIGQPPAPFVPLALALEFATTGAGDRYQERPGPELLQHAVENMTRKPL